MARIKKYSALLEELVEEIITDLISQIHDVKEDEIVIAGELLQLWKVQVFKTIFIYPRKPKFRIFENVFTILLDRD